MTSYLKASKHSNRVILEQFNNNNKCNLTKSFLSFRYSNPIKETTCNNIIFNENSNNNHNVSLYNKYLSLFRPTHISNSQIVNNKNNSNINRLFSINNNRIINQRNYQTNSYNNSNSNNNNSNSSNNSNNQNKTTIIITSLGILSICIGGYVFNFNRDAELLNVVNCQEKNSEVELDLNQNNIILSIDEDDPIIREVEKQLTSNQIFWKLIKQDIWMMALGIVTALLSSWVGIQIPKVFGNLIDSSKKGESLRDPALRAIAVLLIQAGLSFLSTTFISIVCERYTSNLRDMLYSNLLEQEIGFFDKNSTGDLLNRLSADIQLVRSALKHSVTLGVKSVGQIVGGVVSLFLISSHLSLIMLTVLPTMVGIGTIYAAQLKKLSLKAQKSNAQTTSIAQEALGNIRTVVAFASQDVESGKYSDQAQDALNLATKSGVQIGIFQGVTSLALNAVSLLVYWYGGTLVSAGTISSGQLTSFILHTMSMQNSFSQLSILFTQMSNAAGGMSRITEMINRQSHIPRKSGIQLSHIQGRVEFVDVGFRYPTREHVQVLKNFNLTLKPGQVIALAGSSGGGKSTVASLLERFYDVTEGEILVDGVPIHQLSADWLRNQIGIVNQEPALFATSILENLRYGKPDATMEEIEDACRQANAHEFISSFPFGYQTIVGEKGVLLSGGQKQRIAIARAILKNPKILILDEATSALDSTSEGLVQDALQRLMKGRTTMVIAHRLSTVQNADAIAVISNGKVAEIGTHNQLMSKNGLYQQLVQRQLQQT